MESKVVYVLTVTHNWILIKAKIRIVIGYTIMNITDNYKL